MIFCSMNCSMQFSVGLEARQRQAVRLKEEAAAALAASHTPPQHPVKVESSGGSRLSMSANLEETIAAVAAEAFQSPRGGGDSPGADPMASPYSSMASPTSPFPGASPSFKAGKRHYRRSSSQVSEPVYPKVRAWTQFPTQTRVSDRI